MSTLQTYVLQIRRALRGAPQRHLSDILVTRSPGYQLTVDGVHIDRCRFEDLARQGRTAVTADDDERASALFSAALDLWRGPVLADVPKGSQSLPHVIELGENRQYVLEQRMDADLRLGRHRRLIGPLARLAAAYPTNENVRAQFMLALYRSGQRRRALAVFEELRDTLADGLGIEPSVRMQRLHEAIAMRDQALDLVRMSQVATTPGGPVFCYRQTSGVERK